MSFTTFMFNFFMLAWALGSLDGVPLIVDIPEIDLGVLPKYAAYMIIIGVSLSGMKSGVSMILDAYYWIKNLDWRQWFVKDNNSESL